MKVSDLFRGGDKPRLTMCREMLWHAGLVWLVIEKVERREAQLPGAARSTREVCLCFRGVEPGLILKGGRLKFLVRELGGTDTREWIGKRVGLYVDKSYRDRTGSGYGSIQCVVGEHYSGETAPPKAARTSSPGAEPDEQVAADAEPQQSEPREREPGEEG